MTQHTKLNQHNTNIQLIMAIQNGEDRFAEFCHLNNRLICDVSHHYSFISLLEYDDLYNHFLYVAWKCALSFNLESNTKFHTMFYRACRNSFINQIKRKEYQTRLRSVSLYEAIGSQNSYEDDGTTYLDTIASNFGEPTYDEFLKEYCEQVLLPRLGEHKTEIVLHYLFTSHNLRTTTRHFQLKGGCVSRYTKQARRILVRELTKHWI